MKYKCKDNVFVTDLSDRLALLDMETGTYFSLNQTGAFIWEQISNGGSLMLATDALMREYHVDREVAMHDVGALIADLVSHGLLFADDEPIAR